MENEITRVWGVADNIPIIFSRGTGANQWEVSLPTDFSDGQYACEIYAEDIHGRQAMWVGTLYVNKGRAHLHLMPEKAVVWAEPPEVSILPQDGAELCFVPCDYIFVLDDLKKISFEGSCKCGEIPISRR